MELLGDETVEFCEVGLARGELGWVADDGRFCACLCVVYEVDGMSN